MPPKPLCSGQFDKVGRPDSAPASASTATGNASSLMPKCRIGRLPESSSSPQIIGPLTTNTTATPSVWIIRSAQAAPRGPSRLRTGLAVANVRLGSFTVQDSTLIQDSTANPTSRQPTERIAQSRIELSTAAGNRRGLASSPESSLDMACNDLTR